MPQEREAPRPRARGTADETGRTEPLDRRAYGDCIAGPRRKEGDCGWAAGRSGTPAGAVEPPGGHGRPVGEPWSARRAGSRRQAGRTRTIAWCSVPEASRRDTLGVPPHLRKLASKSQLNYLGASPFTGGGQDSDCQTNN